MKSIEIKGQKRESVGKVSTKALRNAELVPCVIYGGGDTIHFSTQESNFKNLVYTSDAHTVTIVLESGEKIDAILQDIQFHPVSDAILHADFYQLNPDKAVSMEIPVRLYGRSRGVTNGGKLRQNLRKLTVKALPSNLPDEIKIDITNLRIGGKIYVEALKNDNYTFMHPDNAVVVAVRTSRVAVDDSDEDESEEAEGESSEGGEE
ncbi:MAG: 50S ribosomal protein L25/general stress protein Ctc [Flavobacteriales bacterium]|nr:50S ribosomal protein L25/general stress protein Ctc [Flavobacteriales bacterium]